MTQETAQHLDKVESVIGRSKEILSRNGYPSDLRTLVILASISQMVEHHEAILLLIRAGKVGSAFALARAVVESMYRGLWINFCANDAQLGKFERRDELPVNMTEMADAIDDKYRAEGFFQDLRKRSWPALNSYAHTGMLQLGRRFTGDKLEPSYSHGEMVEVTTAISTCILMLAAKFLAVQKHDAECRETELLIGTYVVAAARKPEAAVTPAVRAADIKSH